jgi:hypothetical protein
MNLKLLIATLAAVASLLLAPAQAATLHWTQHRRRGCGAERD